MRRIKRFLLSLSLCFKSPKLQERIAAIMRYFSSFRSWRDSFLSADIFSLSSFSSTSYPGKSLSLTAFGRRSAASTSEKSASFVPCSSVPKLFFSLFSCFKGRGKDSFGSPSIKTGMIRLSPCSLRNVSISFTHQSESAVLFPQITIRKRLSFSASSMELLKSLAASSSRSRKTR